jgi:hypothetical protein
MALRVRVEQGRGLCEHHIHHHPGLILQTQCLQATIHAISTPFQRHFRAIATPFQRHFTAYRGLGVAYLAQGDQTRGVSYLKQAREICPQDRLTLYHLAVATGEEAGSLMPAPAPGHEAWRYENERELQMGHLMSQVMCDRPADTAAIYRRAHRKDPSDQMAALRLGAALYCKQDSSYAHTAHML